MRVEKIELSGFKSFAEKTVLDLHPGITCIVGPNGSGKSNVVDSFKWVLGEQSAKSLRGDKMMEVIFGGSQSKKQKGMAEVSLSVSGINGGSPTLVTRRLYRSGESDYMINRSPCRLKDLKDIFLDTGFELKSFAIFEQDNISRIIDSKPEDRRFLIEEVAGVVKYRVRRGEAEAKLESSRLNLQRVSDIIEEVKRQINSLDRQAKKAERYRRLMEELKVLELGRAKKDYTEGRLALAGMEAGLSNLREKDAGLRAGLSELEDRHAQRRLLLAEKEKEAGALEGQLHALEREIAAGERETAVLDTEKEGLKQNIARLTETEEDLRGKTGETEQKIAGTGAEGDALAERISTFENVLREAGGSIENSREAIRELEASMEQARRELFQASEQLSRHLGETGGAESALAGLKRRQISHGTEMESLEKTLSLNEEALKTLSAASEENEVELAKARQKKEELAGQLSDLRLQRQNMLSEIARQREELAYALSRADSLKEMLLSPASKELLASGLPLIKNTLSDVIEAAPEYERAIEAALRGFLFLSDGFIVPDRAYAVRALKTLRDKDIERTSFIPLSIRAGKAPEGPLPEGIIGRAVDFVKIQPGYEAAVGALLSDILIVREIEDAPEETEGGKYIYVSLDGETIEPSGALSGGRTRGLLARKRQLRGLEEETEKLRSAVAAREEELSNMTARSEEVEKLLAAEQERLHALEKEATLLSHSRDSSELEIERLKKKSSGLKLEGEEINAEISGMEETLGRLAEAKGALESGKAEMEQKIAALRERLSQARQDFEAESAGHTEQRLELNSLKQALEGVRKETRRLELLKAEMEKALLKAGSERLASERAVEEKEGRAAQVIAALREAVKKADHFREALLEKRREQGSLGDGLIELERSIKAAREEIDSLGRRIAEGEVGIAEMKMRLENLAEGIKNTYDVEIEAYEAGDSGEDFYERESAGEKIAELKKKISDLGPVSLAAIGEYEELKSRFSFLDGQRQDLEKSIAELEEAIKKINSTTRHMLREAYDTLTVKFSQVFTEFFGGGRAELALTNEADILESGIEIIAQPPGKKLQNINLLSGGEKSLAALSLLFASFLIKPTPLCILDEADAALDEANTVKFAGMLKTLSASTQFVVITHNRVTMEAADYIYGVSMQEPGVSGVISMRLTVSPEGA